MSSILKDGLDNVLDNDEEMAMQAVDSDNEINEQMEADEAAKTNGAKRMMKSKK